MSFTQHLHAEKESVGKPSKSEVMQKTRKLQMPFIVNNGQIDEKVKYYAMTLGGSVFITKDGEIVYSMPVRSSEIGVRNHYLTDSGINRQASQRIDERMNRGTEIQGVTQNFGLEFPSNKRGEGVCSFDVETQSTKPDVRHITLKETLVDGKICKIKGEDKAVTKVSCFKGRAPSNWKSDIPTYDVVTLGEVYNGIELKLKAYGNTVEKLFYVKSDASPDRIKLSFEGANDLRINRRGELEVETECGTVKFTKPVAYQVIDGKRVEVAVEYSIQKPEDRSHKQEVRGSSKETGMGRIGEYLTSNFQPPTSNLQFEIQNPKSKVSHSEIHSPHFEYGFKVASYDRTKELIIDPLLASTFLTEKASVDTPSFITIDSKGNLYIASSDYECCISIFKLNSDLTNLLASIYLEGSGSGNYCSSIVIGSDGNVYLTGYTLSSDFPTTAGVYDTTYNGAYNTTFVSKLNSELTNLLASTYLGGSGSDRSHSMVLGLDGNIYVTGDTLSLDFPVTAGAYDTTMSSDDKGANIFISRLNSDLSSLITSTYLGGNNSDQGYGIAVDSSADVYVVGRTYSKNFPTTKDAYDSSYNDDKNFDVVVSKLDGNLSNLLASTYLGGSDTDYPTSIVIGSDGNVYVSGVTESLDFPTSENAYDTSHNCVDDAFWGYGLIDIFVSKLDGDLKNILASTYLGGSYPSFCNFATLDSVGNIYVAGWTASENFPTTKGAYDDSYNDSYVGSADAIVSKLNGNLTKLLASTFLGGSGKDFGDSLALDTNRNVYVTGNTDSIDFPVTPDAYNTSYEEDSTYNSFVSKFDSNLSADTSTGRIYGYVKDANGEPIESAKLKLKGENTKFKDIKFSDENGFFEFAYLGADSYKITATKEGYKKEQQDVELGQGEEEAVEIVMETK